MSRCEFLGGPLDGHRSHVTDEAARLGFVEVPAVVADAARPVFAHYEICERGFAYFRGYTAGLVPIREKN